MITISKVNLKELTLYTNDPRIAERDILPISRVRALSFMTNPRADSNDNVLYQAHRNDNLVGYLTVLPDTAFVGNRTLKFAWIGGAWVHPAYRRQGIAISLIDAVVADWNGMLMAANFSPVAMAVFEKSKTFRQVKVITGRRFYLRKTTLKTYNCCIHDSFFPLMAERVANLFNYSVISRHILSLPKGIEVEYYSRPDEEILEILSQSTHDTLTRRGIQELNWIIRYPWLTSGVLPDRAAAKFFFASVIPKFNQYLVKVYKDSDLVGVLLMQHSNTRFTVPYFWYEKGMEKVIAKTILLHASKCGASFINLYNDELVNAMRKLKIFYYYSVMRNRQYLAADTLADLLPPNFKLTDGDGESAFI